MKNTARTAPGGNREQQPRELNEALPALESVLCTEELNRRPAREPDYERESRALVSLAQALADSPRTILQTLAEKILEVFQADSAGISLVTEDGARFHWPAIAGVWKPHIGGGTPRDFGPCGDVLDRNSPLLFRHFERRYTYFLPVKPPVEECLLVPFYVEEKAVGTIWAIAHDDRRKFDGEDLRMLVSLGTFASAAYQAVEQLHAHNEQAQERQDAAQTLREMNEALLVSSVHQQELTEQARQAEAALSRVNNDLVNLIASVEMAIVILGPDLRVRRFTPTAKKLLKLVPADVGRPLADIQLNLVHLPDLEPLLSEAQGTVSVQEHKVQDQDGRWYALRLRPYRTLDNKVDGVVVMLVDIDLLKRSHAYTESIVATVREPLLVLDMDLRVRTASDSFYQTYRVKPEETINRLLYDLGNGQWNIPELRRLLEEVLPQSNRVNDFEVEHAFESIGIKAMRLNARRLVQLKEHDPLILLAIEDVTESKRQTHELRQVAADMSEADRRKNEFLAMLAHELRNPLAPIRNALKILRLTEGNGEAVQSASAMMERQVGQMVRLVDDLLDVSRITRGKIELRRGRIELASVVHHALEASRSLHQSMNHELNVTLPPQAIYLNADPARLAQVVGNLLNNACKFTDKGGRIWLAVEREGDQAVIRVRDNGIGISADQLPHIFEMFMQVDTSLERSVSGLGIGLTLVKSLVEMHGGTVEVHSSGTDLGTEFVVRLPITAAENGPAPGPAESEPGAMASRRILVVDDNRDSASTLAMLLELTGNTMQTAYDGLEAVAMAETFRPDIILLDIGLPKLNGYEACRQIRELPWGENVVIVALTGWGQEEDRKKSKDAGFNGHMVKPVELSALMKLLAGLLPTPV